MEIKEVLDKLYVISYEVRRNLEPGYLEKAYENAFCVEFGIHGIPYQVQPGLVVKYKGVDVGDYRPIWLWMKRLLWNSKQLMSLTMPILRN